MVSVGWRALCAVFVGLCLACGARAEDQPAKADAVKPAGPLSIKDFVGPPTLSLPKLSPSGKKLVIVRRVGEIDQILRIDLPDIKPVLLFQTNPVSAVLAKNKWRNRISYMEWKTDDTLLVSESGPVRAYLYGQTEYFDLPIHMIIDANGQKPPMLLNDKISGGRGTVELSWIQSVLRDDPAHIQLTVRPTLDTIQVDQVDIATGQRVVLERGSGAVSDYGTDRKGAIVTRTLEDDGILTLQGRAPGETRWTKITDIRAKEERELAKYEFLGEGQPGVLYVAAKPQSPAEGDTKTVHTYDLKTMTLGPVVWSNPTYDVDDIVQDDDTGEIAAGCYWIDTYRCDFKSAKLTANLKALNKFFHDERNISIVSQARDDSRWVLFVEGPDEPGSYYLYDVQTHQAKFLGALWNDLAPERLSPMRRFAFKARDGLQLSGYVTEPQGPAAKPRPLIVMPHGGPEARDKYVFDTWAQFLASRGYVVLQPNFRGSAGFGRKFAEAGYGEWGGRMHDDVMDATRALIAEGKVDPKRVCIVGASYGGYEALYSAATEPATFKCAISIDGLSDMVGEMKFERSFGRDSGRYNYWLKSQGDPAKDGPRMLAHSPYRLAADWKTPVLLIHGDKDEIVPVEESRQMKRALDGANKPVRYIEIAGMGHGPGTEEESTKVLTEMESFLALHLGDGAAPGTSSPGSATH